MSKLAITTAAALGALAAVRVWGEWVYEAEWGKNGAGDGEFTGPKPIGVSSRTGRVYVYDAMNYRIQYFTGAGSFLGKWDGRLDIRSFLRYSKVRSMGRRRNCLKNNGQTADDFE